MFFRRQPSHQNTSPFSLQEGDIFDSVSQNRDDKFFDEAFRGGGNSALEPTKSFVGNIIPKQRFIFGSVFLGTVLLLFAGRASALQIIAGEDYRLQAEDNRTRNVVLPSQRGIIYDRNGKILAENIPTFRIVTTTGQLPFGEEERRILLERFAELMRSDVEEIFTLVEETDYWDEDILLAEKLSYEQAMMFAVHSKDFPGLHLEAGSRRKYITDEIPSLSHLLGYTAAINEDEYAEKRAEGYRKFDHIGKLGIEKSYESLLRGTYGVERLEVDALGSTVRIISKDEPVDGENLTLTIDADLQAYTERVLATHMADSVAKKASVVVMNPKNGEVLTLVSWPAYDANLFVDGISHEDYKRLIEDENQPLFPRAYAGEFPSGSTIKPVYAAAALMEGIINANTSFVSTGGIRIGVWYFPDWRGGGHGVTNVYHAIADSVNTFFYIIGGGLDSFEGLGLEKLMDYASKFGFGKSTGLDIGGEADGFLPTKRWKMETKGEQWYIGDTYHVSIGQGDFLTTPLQVALSTAIFANNGVRVQPHLASHVEPASERVVDEETARIIREAMRRTVTSGTAQTLNALPVTSAGKTGTAQWYTQGKNHTWYTGFAPYEDPSIVITVLVEEGADDYLSVLVTKDILDWWFSRAP